MKNITTTSMSKRAARNLGYNIISLSFGAMKGGFHAYNIRKDKACAAMTMPELLNAIAKLENLI